MTGRGVIVFKKYISSFFIVCFPTLFSMVLLVLLQNSFSFQLPNNDSILDFFEGTLGIEEFIPAYFSPFTYSAIHSVLAIALMIVFSTTLNLCVHSTNWTINLRKTQVRIIWSSAEFIVVLRFSTLILMMWCLSQPFSDGNPYILLFGSNFYILFTLLILQLNPKLYYKSNRCIWRAYTFGIPLLAFIAFLAIWFRYSILGFHLLLFIFVLLLWVVEAVSLILFTAIPLSQLDFASARKGKKKIRERDKDEDEDGIAESLGNYIKKRNKDNLVVSVNLFLMLILHLAIISIVYFVLAKPVDTTLFTFLYQALLGYMLLVLFRFFLRSTEIVLAFIKDVTDNKGKSTKLDGQERMLLAIKSLAETVILAGVIRISYSLYTEMSGFMNNTSCKIHETLVSVVEPIALMKLFMEEFLFSIAVAGFNVSFPTEGEPLIPILHIIQLLVSITLITLSIATYISMGGKFKR